MEYLYWQSQDKKTLKKINNLLKAIQREPFTGEGKTEQTSEFPHYLYYRNFKVRALRKKQSGYAKRFMEKKIGNRTLYSRSQKIVIYMRKWGIGKQEKQR